MPRPLVPALLAVALAVGLLGCGGDDGATTSGGPTTSGPTSETAAPSSPDENTTSPTTSTAPDGTSPPDGGDLPGERIETYPYEGAELAVVGVEANDVLNLRAGPGTDAAVVVELAPLATGLVATGHNRALEAGGTWAEVSAQGATGWVNVAFTAQLGATTDATDRLGQVVGGETMVDIAGSVASLLGPSGDDPQPTVTVVDGPVVSAVGEITVDVLGYADDSARGERFHIVADPDASGESFTVSAVEATVLCARGAGDGLCL